MSAPDRDVPILILNDRTPIVVDVEIVRCTEDRYDGRELLRRCLAMHRVPGVLRFVSTEDAQ